MNATRILGPLAVLLLIASAVACGDDDTIAAAPPANDGGAAVCGNGILEPNEECEGFELRGATCDSLGLSVGLMKCGADCKLDTTGCGGKCGDGQIQGSEQCDGANLNGKTCAALLGGEATGTLSCSSDCHFIIDACKDAPPLGQLLSCDATSNNCVAPSSCVTTSTGSFCLEACDLAASACGANRYCEEIGGGKGACADVPAAGSQCSARSGCATAGQTCIPTYNAASPISVCAKSCPATEVGKGQGSCGAGESCITIADGPIEQQKPDACTSSTDCDGSQGYTCNPVVTAAGEVKRCTRPYGQCAPITPLYKFDGSTTPDNLLCDRTKPTRGAAKCGLASATPLVNPARVDCVEHFTGTPDIGVCTAFCEGDGAAGPIDLACGDAAKCAVPSKPEFFVPQGDATPVSCTACGASFDKCIDLGRGQECARAVKVCVPN